jgi:hypothetical protein
MRKLWAAAAAAVGTMLGGSAVGGALDTSDGKPIMQLGLQGFDANYAGEEAFADLTMLMGNSWAAESKSGLPTKGFAELWRQGLIGYGTMIPKRIPAGYDFIRSGPFRDARYYPGHYAGTYVLEWRGDADLRFGFGLRTCPAPGYSCQKKISANRVEATFVPGDKQWSRIEITRIGKGLYKVFLYRKENAAAALAGGFNPRFLSYASRYKVLRTLDIQGASTSDVRSVDRLKKKGHFGYGGNWRTNLDAPAAPVGSPLQVLFELGVSADTEIWTHVQPYLGAPAGLPWVDQSKLRGWARTRFLEIIGSPEWRKWADEVVRSLNASGYPRSRTFYSEVANETWNTSGPFNRQWQYYQGIGDVFDRGASFSVGYLSGHYAKQLDAALKAAGRSDQKWVIVLAGQMANSATTRAALDGFKQYFTDRGIDPAPFLKRAGVSTASYYSDTFSKERGIFQGATDDAVRLQWLTAIASDPAGLSKRIADRLILGSDKDVGTIPFLVRMRKIHQKQAEEAGAFFLGDYEGGSHDQVSWLKSDSRLINFVENFRRGSQGERVDKAWIEAMRSQNPKAIIANYRGVSLGDPEGDSPTDATLASAWDDGFYTETTARNRALDPYLRGSSTAPPPPTPSPTSDPAPPPPDDDPPCSWNCN